MRPREPGSVTPRQGDNGGSAPSSLPSTPTPDNYDALPHKKRKFLQRIQQQEDVSSSDSEPQDKAKQNPITQVCFYYRWCNVSIFNYPWNFLKVIVLK